MPNGLFITNKVPSNVFAQTGILKYSAEYFTTNGWTTKYITDEWDNKLDQYEVVLLWCLQELEDQRPLKRECLFRLLEEQHKHNFIILDYIEDLHQVFKFFILKRNIYTKNFKKDSKNYILTRYGNRINKYYPNCNYYVLPYSIPLSIIPQFNYEPVNRILLTGSLSNSYPKRVAIANLKDQYPIDVLEHPTYRELRHQFIGETYFNKINEYIASIATCAAPQYNYIVAKYFEIPATGALLFAYIEPVIDELTKYGFQDMTNMIAFNDDNLIEKIQYIINPQNINEINKIRHAGYELIKEKHTHEVRFFIELNTFIENIIKNNNIIKQT